uniref:Uncharacterized protein n=1 Tax=Heliothis virescens TaxID=7102 RepID=A0A2A4J6C4_HELVI
MVKQLMILGGGRRECEEAAGCACGGQRAPPVPPAPPAHHPLHALEQMPPPLLRSNPLYTEEEEQEVVIIVDSLDEVPEGEAVEPPRTPRRAPSTSSGYGSGGGSHGRVSPNLPKSEQFEPPARRLSGSDKNDGSHTTSDSDSPVCTLSRSLKEDIRSCLGGCRWEKDVNDVVEAAVRGAGGISAARARLHAALLALHEPLPRLPNRGPSLPYCGPGVRPGDVTMMPKNTEMSLLVSYGSGGGSHGRVSPNLPKSEQFEPPARRLSGSDKNDGSHTTSDSDSPVCTLSRSLKEDIRSCLGGCRWEKDVNDVVEAAVRGAGGISAARARLHAALLALHEPLPRLPNRGPSLPYCGPGVRPGDVTMMPKNTEMSLLAASALFTLDGARGEALSRRLARSERRRRRCRAALAIIALLLLLAAVGAVELLMSRGQRVFGAVLR